MAKVTLFNGSTHAEQYAKFRPKTPVKVAEMMMEYVKNRVPLPESGRYSLLVDVGCGSGQSTEIFAPFFDSLVGIDPSENQIMQASKYNKCSKIKYIVGNAENLVIFENESVDLIAVGEAVHWFDIPDFLKECQRVLKPSGCLFLYGFIRFNLDGKADELAKAYYDMFDWHPKIKILEGHYKEIFNVLACEHKTTNMLHSSLQMTLSTYQEYLTTWGAYNTYISKPGVNVNVLGDFIEKLKNFWNVENKKNENIVVTLNQEMFMIMSTRPILS